jgi:hypothetical protein
VLVFKSNAEEIGKHFGLDGAIDTLLNGFKGDEGEVTLMHYADKLTRRTAHQIMPSSSPPAVVRSKSSVSVGVMAGQCSRARQPVR